MDRAIRNTLVVIVSIISGYLLINIADHYAYQLYDIHRPADMFRVPAGFLAFMVLSYALSALISGWMIRQFAATKELFMFQIAGLVWMLIGVSEVITHSYPVWFSVSLVSVCFPMVILGGRKK